MRPADVEACSRLSLMDAAAYDAATRALLPKLWRELLAEGWTESCLLEDLDRPPPARLLGFGLVVFLADDFLDAARRPDAPPYVNRQIVDEWRAGRSPLLDQQAARRANSGRGVNLHTFHQSMLGSSPHLCEPDMVDVMNKTVEAFLDMGRGYRIRETTIEVYGPSQLQWNLNGGFLLRSDHANFYQDHPADPPPADERPYLLGLGRAEAEGTPGTTIGTMFAYAPPRIFFAPGEQDVLRQALLDLTDEEIAAELCLSLPTVRKRWNAIYGRTEATLSGLLPEEKTVLPGTYRRGQEKRRRLMAHLRTHPEELRPVLPPK